MSRSQPIRDLCCGMRVDPTSSATIDYKGTTYYFCSRHCAQVFSLDPERFLRHPARPNPYRVAPA